MLHYVLTGWEAVQELRCGIRSVFLCRLQIVWRCGSEAVPLRTVRHLQVPIVFTYSNVVAYLHCRIRTRTPNQMTMFYCTETGPIAQTQILIWILTLDHYCTYLYRPQTKFAKVMFSQAFYLSTGGEVSVQGGGSSVQGEGSLSGGRGSLSKGGFCPGGVSVQGGLCTETPRTVKELAYVSYWNAFLLERILIPGSGSETSNATISHYFYSCHTVVRVHSFLRSLVHSPIYFFCLYIGPCLQRVRLQWASKLKRGISKSLTAMLNSSVTALFYFFLCPRHILLDQI